MLVSCSSANQLLCAYLSVCCVTYVCHLLQSSDNFYDERAPNGGTASGAACAAVCASNDFMSPGKPREEIG